MINHVFTLFGVVNLLTAKIVPVQH